MSNSLGTINPIEKIIKLSHANKAEVLIDGAQAAAVIVHITTVSINGSNTITGPVKSIKI